MKTNKMRQKSRIVMIVVAVVIILAMVVTYAIPFAAFAESGNRIIALEDDPVVTPEPDPPAPPEPPTPEPEPAPPAPEPDPQPAPPQPQPQPPQPQPIPVQPEPEPEEEPEPLLTIKIKGAPDEMNIGDEVTLFAELTNEKEGTVVKWESGNKDVAMVDSDGKVVAVGDGTVDIFAMAENVKASVVIKVAGASAEKILIKVKGKSLKQDQSELVIKLGEIYHLTAELEPKDAKMEAYTWEVSDEDILSIDSTGELIALKVGEADVTVTMGELTSSLTFKVEESGIPIYIIVGVIILIVIIIVVIVVVVDRNRKKKIALEEAAKKRARERRLREEAAIAANAAEKAKATPPPPPQPEQNIIEIDQSTKVFGQGVGVIEPEVKPDAEDTEPDKPFSLDDID